MKIPRILITGASGCVGQYIAVWLLENSNAELLLWLRDPKKLKAISKDHKRIKLLIGDLREPKIFADELSKVTHVIHTATAWGDPQRAYQVNVTAVKELLNMLNPKIIEKIIYFSTASILDRFLKPLPQALRYGTEYIQTKAICLDQLETHPLKKKIIAVFPTLVFGGRVDSKSNYPTSYLTEGLMKACEWLWLARWIKLDSFFHFIHASDIAFVCGTLALRPHAQVTEEQPPHLKKIVLAQKSTNIDETIRTMCRWRDLRRTPSIPLKNWLIQILIKILPIQITDWDRFSIKQRNFIHSPITTPETLGGISQAPTLEDILQISGVPKASKSNKRGKLT